MSDGRRDAITCPDCGRLYGDDCTCPETIRSAVKQQTDYEKLKKCFDEIGVDYEEDIEVSDSILRLEDGDGHVVEFLFDSNGKYEPEELWFNHDCPYY